MTINEAHVAPASDGVEGPVEPPPGDPAGPETPGQLPPNNLVGILTACGVVVTAVATLGGLLGWFGWSNGQWVAVGATAGAALGLVTSLVAHLRRSTRGEPVAVAASLTALATATAALGVVFSWWTDKPDVQGAVVALITATFGLLMAIFARGRAQPTS